MCQDLVSVVMPAYNAEQFIERSLLSASRQTHGVIEIVVVDDGSTDRTASIVESFAAKDPRVRLIRQCNQGVAAARNTGVLHSRGEFIAPLDADDLWDPSKIEKQMRAFADGGPDLALVYALYRAIDADDNVVSSVGRHRPEGWVFLQHANQNFIGNGSSVLMRRSAVEEAGGYSSRLREAGLEGCEDIFLQLSIAARLTFALVPEYLVGYRRTPSNMSSNALRMVLSRKLVLESFLARCEPVAEPAIREAIFRNDVNIVRLGLRRGHYRMAARTCARIATGSPSRLVDLAREFQATLGRIATSARAEAARPAPRRPFHDYWSLELDDVAATVSRDLQHAMAEFRRLDDELGPRQGYLRDVAERGSLATDRQT